MNYDYKHLMRQYGGRLEPETKGPGEVKQPEWIGQGSHRPGIGFEMNGYCIWCNCPVSASQCNAPVKVHVQ